MKTPIAIVAMAARYASGETPKALWDAALHQRRHFRPIPASRLPLDAYVEGEEAITVRTAGLIEGWHFDAQKFQVPREQLESTDPTHWLALDVSADLIDQLATLGLEIAGEDRAGVVLGNSLTGEVSRAGVMGLRWPYVRQSVLKAAHHLGRKLPQEFLTALEKEYKAPFPTPTTETLAGGLSNTIAGRIANRYDLHGLGFTVDAACASSLISVIQVSSLLQSGTIDIGIAGGVDMSIDPFELVGFSQLGALSTEVMRVFDTRPTGFLPGEGCGLVALMRLPDAERRGIPILAVIAGAGMSSDGAGGLTRPEEHGHLRAAQRAYSEANIDPGEVGLFEAHGTGTAVGDTAEINVLSSLHSGTQTRAALGTIKANVGHTKAAAGVAGLIKAVSAVQSGILPPTTGVSTPHKSLRNSSLRILAEPEDWQGVSRVAAVSALGFGGINAHAVLLAHPSTSDGRRSRKIGGRGDLALLVITGDSISAVITRLERLADAMSGYSDAECAQACNHESGSADLGAPIRVAVYGTTRAEMLRGIWEACDSLRANDAPGIRAVEQAWVGIGPPMRVAYLFPGQGAPIPRARLAIRRALTDDSSWAHAHDEGVAFGQQAAGAPGTEVAQPAIMGASLAGLGWLDALGVQADAAAGHSLGEIAALVWGRALEPAHAVDLAARRGQYMAEYGEAGTGMLSVAAAPDAVDALLESYGSNHGLVISAMNGSHQTVLGGTLTQLHEVSELARRRGMVTHQLTVSHAFHSPAMDAVIGPFRRVLDETFLTPVSSDVISSVTASSLRGRDSHALRSVLSAQLRKPVRFTEVIQKLARRVELTIEVGPGSALTDIARDHGIPAASLQLTQPERGLAGAVAALIAAGKIDDLTAWAKTTGTSRVTFTHRPLLLTNPCGLQKSDAIIAEDLPVLAKMATPLPRPTPASPAEQVPTTSDETNDVETLLVAHLQEATGLMVGPKTRNLRFSTDLHLNSLQVNHLVGTVAEALGKALPADPLALAEASVGEAIDLIVELPSRGTTAPVTPADEWVAIFEDAWDPVEARSAAKVETMWTRTILPEGLPDKRPCESASLHVVLPSKVTDREIMMLVKHVQHHPWRRIVVQHQGEGPAAARVLWKERVDPDQRWALLQQDEPASTAELDALPAVGFGDYRRTTEGNLERRIVRQIPASPEQFQFAANDPLVLVTGGIHGITAQCALELARNTGARLLFVARTPADDPGVREALTGFAKQGISAEYRATDLTKPDELRSTLAGLRIAGLLHGAAVNRPAESAEVDSTDLEEASAIKSGALDTLLNIVVHRDLELVVTFGSIIERCGLRGQLAYAVANERLATVTERLAFCGVRALHLRWSVWSEMGMGVSLGVVDGLARQGVAPISPSAGRRQFWQAISKPGPVERLITGRFPEPDSLTHPTIETPMLRYLETIESRFGTAEIVAHAELSIHTDRALHAHRISGVPVLPLVCMLEAAAQAATCLDPTLPGVWTRISDIQITRPVALGESERAQLSVAASVAATGGVRCTIGNEGAMVARMTVHHVSGSSPSWAPGSFKGTGHPWYGPLYFHKGSFERVTGQAVVSASSLTCTLDTTPSEWFSAFLPTDLVLGDTGVLDATIHALQACHPATQLLPVSASLLEVSQRAPRGDCTLRAQEITTQSDKSQLIFDVEVIDESGSSVLRWHKLALQPAHKLAGVVSPELVAPALARAVRDLGWSDAVDAQVTTSAVSPAQAADATFGSIGRDPGGRPVAELGYLTSSTSHGWRITAWDPQLPVGVDWEFGSPPAPQLADGLLSLVEQVTAIVNCSPDTAAVMLWSALEAARKTGETAGLHLEIIPTTDSPGVVFRAGHVFVLAVQFEMSEPCVAAIAIGEKR